MKLFKLFIKLPSIKTKFRTEKTFNDIFDQFCQYYKPTTILENCKFIRNQFSNFFFSMLPEIVSILLEIMITYISTAKILSYVK